MILFLTRIPPNSNGHGGSQRAMHLLKALARLGPVDVMLIHRSGDRDALETDMSDARRIARFCGKMRLSDWESSEFRWPGISHRQQLVADIVTPPFCAEAPRIGRGMLRSLAEVLPTRRYDLIFAGRLPCAAVAEQMLRRRLLEARRKVVDFDDIMSRVGLRQLGVDGARQGSLWRLTKRIDCRRVLNAERAVMRGWDAVSVCTYDDADLLRGREPNADVVRVPNVVDKIRLPATAAPNPRILFVGSLAHGPNVQGLQLFLREAWPRIKKAVPEAAFRIVGMLPYPELRAQVESVGAELHVDVPSVEPFYRDCDIVVAPIFFGGGTRIKVLEAMSYGRAVVSTTIGAEGLHLEPGRHVLIADELSEMADACVRLCRDERLRTSLVNAAYDLQQREFGPAALDRAVREMVVDHAGADPAALAAIA